MKFNRLTIIEKVSSKKYRCKCDCGNETVVYLHHLKSGGTKSCGCLKKEMIGLTNYKHGHAGNSKTTKIYHAWEGMKARCYNKNYPKYDRWGGRGIKVCDRWLESFENFLADMGEPPGKEYSVDRKDNNGNYEPNNCRWATDDEQQQNRG